MKKYMFSILLLYGLCSFGQTKALYNKSIEAYQNKNYPLFLEITKQLDSIRPHHPTFTYNLASAFTLNCRNAEALLVLRHLVLANNTVSFEDDPDFESLRNSEDFQKIKQLKSKQGEEIQNSKLRIKLTEKDLHPESVIFLENHKLWLASSIRNKKIITFDSATGKCNDWFTDSLYSVFAMKADNKQEYLWVACSAIPEMKGFSKEMEGKSEVLKIHIATRKIVNRFSVQGNHVFGDLIVSNNNEVYISDSADPLIYKIADNKISLWKDLRNEAFNLQGITFNEDQTKIFIADYLKGIAVINIENNNYSWLAFPENATNKGIDGLVFCKNSLIAIHNGAIPIRIAKYQLDKEGKSILDFTILDNNRSEFNEPALASLFKNKLYFFANSPWKFYSKDFVLDEIKIQSPKLFELTLD